MRDKIAGLGRARRLNSSVVICALGCMAFGSMVTATGCHSTHQRYALHGQVVRKGEAANQIIVKSDEIPGFMAAMTMPYKVHDPAEMQKMEPGDVISADLIVTKEGNEYWLENIRVVDSSGRKPPKKGD